MKQNSSVLSPPELRRLPVQVDCRTVAGPAEAYVWLLFDAGGDLFRYQCATRRPPIEGRRVGRTSNRPGPGRRRRSAPDVARSRPGQLVAAGAGAPVDLT